MILFESIIKFPCKKYHVNQHDSDMDDRLTVNEIVVNHGRNLLIGKIDQKVEIDR